MKKEIKNFKMAYRKIQKILTDKNLSDKDKIALASSIAKERADSIYNSTIQSIKRKQQKTALKTV